LAYRTVALALALAGQFGAPLDEGGYNVGIGHKCATVQFMGQRIDLLEQLAAAKRQAEEAEANIEAQLNTFVSGMVIGNAMTTAENVLKTSELALQGHRSDIERILDDLDKLPLFDGDAQS
jgi:hypothetical protein